MMSIPTTSALGYRSAISIAHIPVPEFAISCDWFVGWPSMHTSANIQDSLGILQRSQVELFFECLEQNFMIQIEPFFILCVSCQFNRSHWRLYETDRSCSFSSAGRRLFSTPKYVWYRLPIFPTSVLNAVHSLLRSLEPFSKMYSWTDELKLAVLVSYLSVLIAISARRLEETYSDPS